VSYYLESDLNLRSVSYDYWQNDTPAWFRLTVSFGNIFQLDVLGSFEVSIVLQTGKQSAVQDMTNSEF
jgi:hypothetical protein